ncbi:hypothetical protein [Mesorhizobium sp.]|uniref:hypothetical protein n=1 Tax=Mesorhizobium sp. TaxID=1871066 RepID=UPI000FE33213|nr:hypothetical protein [Mesorhizobium sp.]RWK39271.1 MAG: hypothetical protein EOR40_04475 [Mesorhizobium sp.]
MSEHDDIMEAAFGLTAGDWNQPHDVRAKKVAAAILAERERCAKVVASLPLCKLTKTTAAPGDHYLTFEVGASAQRRVSVKAILSGQPPEPTIDDVPNSLPSRPTGAANASIGAPPPSDAGTNSGDAP